MSKQRTSTYERYNEAKTFLEKEIKAELIRSDCVDKVIYQHYIKNGRRLILESYKDVDGYTLLFPAKENNLDEIRNFYKRYT